MRRLHQSQQPPSVTGAAFYRNRTAEGAMVRPLKQLPERQIETMIVRLRGRRKLDQILAHRTADTRRAETMAADHGHRPRNQQVGIASEVMDEIVAAGTKRLRKYEELDQLLTPSLGLTGDRLTEEVDIIRANFEKTGEISPRIPAGAKAQGVPANAGSSRPLASSS